MDANGDIYVGALARDPAGHDTVYMWRSKDGGDSWDCAYRLPDDSLDGPIPDYEVRAGGDAAGPWIYDFLIIDDSAISGGLWMSRHRVPMEDQTWVKVASGGDTILRLAADRNTESPERLFVAWETQNGIINLASSADSGQTWGNPRTAFTGCECPTLCAGGDGCVYVAAAHRDSAWIQIARYSNNLADSTPVAAKLDSSGDRQVWNPSIAADRSSPESMQTAVVMYSHRDTAGKITPHFGWTTTGGLVWTSAVWPATNQGRTTWDARFPCVRRSYDDDLIRAVVTMHEPSKNWDTIVYAFARPGTPTVWEDRAVRNEYRVSDIVGAKVGFSQDCMGGYTAYAEYGVDKVFFNGYDFVGIGDDAISDPVQDGLRAKSIWGQPFLELSLARPGRVRVAAFDACGRLVDALYDGNVARGNHRLELDVSGLRPGLYYLIVQSNRVRQVTKMVLAGNS